MPRKAMRPPSRYSPSGRKRRPLQGDRREPGPAMELEDTKTPTLPNAGRVGYSQRQNQLLGVDVQKWYHAAVSHHQEKNRERVGHPSVMILKLLKILVVAACMIAATLVIHMVTLNTPFILYEMRQAPITRDCSMIHAGMSRADMLSVFNKSTPPRQESLSLHENKVLILREDGSCVVELNSLHDTVMKAWVDPQLRASLPGIDY